MAVYFLDDLFFFVFFLFFERLRFLLPPLTGAAAGSAGFAAGAGGAEVGSTGFSSVPGKLGIKFDICVAIGVVDPVMLAVDIDAVALLIEFAVEFTTLLVVSAIAFGILLISSEYVTYVKIHADIPIKI